MSTPPFDRISPSESDDFCTPLSTLCGLESPILSDLIARGGKRLDPSETSPAEQWAASGAMWLTGPAEEPPRFARGPLAAVAYELGQILNRLAPDRTCALADAPALLGERAALAGLERRGTVSAGGSARLLPSAEGWIAINLPRPDDWRAVPAWLGDEAPAIEAQDWAKLGIEIQRRSSTSLVERGRLLGLAVTEANKDSPDLRPAILRTAASERRPPVHSAQLKVLDLSHLWAGPLAASLLAHTGADVLKIEAPARPDGARSGPPAFFNLMQQSKLGCALDLNNESDRILFEQLLEHADIVIESARPRSLEQLGYDAASWSSSRAGRLWVSITGYGRSAPERDWIAFGDDAAIAAGLAWPPVIAPVLAPVMSPVVAPNETTKNEANPVPQDPCFCADAIADPLTGLQAAVAALAHYRAGIGGVLDLSLSAVAAAATRRELGPVTAPLAQHQGNWFIETRSGLRPVEPPRARTAAGEAPPLRPPTPALLAHWTAPC